MQITLNAAGDGPVEVPNPDPFGANRENLARGKHATQSSTAYRAPAALAVDGNRKGDFAGHSFTHTGTAEPAWWQVDLGSDIKISDIYLFNRTDTESQRFSNYDVEILNGAGTVVWSEHQDGFPISSKVFSVGGVVGRTVRIRLLGAGVPLSLAEVEVYASVDQ
ncbi:discoidin domain-containing protein [Collinsella ureilytica]|uniref:discoidin domain-containing protein n=1 Tax=Collinsella ureilytica TaxID=2869515 RepID=UPI00352CA7C7